MSEIKADLIWNSRVQLHLHWSKMNFGRQEQFLVFYFSKKSIRMLNEFPEIRLHLNFLMISSCHTLSKANVKYCHVVKKTNCIQSKLEFLEAHVANVVKLASKIWTQVKSRCKQCVPFAYFLKSTSMIDMCR